MTRGGVTGGDNVVWLAEPHTLAKHQVYRQYLSKWMPIMIQSWKGNVTYAEGFSGPGVYVGGEPGSPVIALETLLRDPALRTRARDLRFLFVESQKSRSERLSEELEKAARPVPLRQLDRYGIDLAIATGDYDPTLTELLTEHNAWGRPMLVVLDTFGGSVKLDLVRRIAQNPSSEVIITFEPQHFIRWAKVDRIRHGDTVFGDPDWRRVDEQPESAKAKWVVDKYRTVLQDAGFSYVLTFELVNTRGLSLFLVFGTTHVRGLQKMKEAMWEVDPISGVQYRDPADPDQELLDIKLEPLTEPLRRELLQYLRNQPKEHAASVSDLRRFALYRTVYKESQVKPELDILVDKKLALADGTDGRVRLGGSVRLTAAGLESGG
ncbi:three-Cys-motif partner protein TcmP [Phytoactinopolyspora mesophila]|uniref:Three-Cys-motif partner protein TcmP n=1 Tax=Phytoactinopolyspora mesophila TaxID=2650750 RepID=A0A7K3M1B6_9ACTN|nr:three-Cys-motif partner protein TcmP [Phytoactinopolyspora mesophila]NDL57040.1 three-Cys-motif partner protein TcmP [Phytoactinopolyspora mesophila]